MYLAGHGVRGDLRVATRWFRKSADLGQREAVFEIADLVRLELAPMEPREALQWLVRAAKLGDAASQAELGIRYCEGEGVRRDYREGLRWYRRAARQGNADALSNIGLMYRVGQGVKRSWPRALAHYRRAALAGDGTSFFWLLRYYEGLCGAPADPRVARTWLRRAHGLGRKGHEEVYEFLGSYYISSQGHERNPRRALRWLELAAANDDEDALVYLGLELQIGEGVKRDPRRAATLYRRAAELGDDSGAYLLGLCYQEGDGVRRDGRLERKWLRLAAERGHPRAAKELAAAAR
jgi:TPR repeat protein